MTTYDIPEELLDDIEDYFDQRADAETPPGYPTIPNEEMSLLVRLQKAKGEPRRFVDPVSLLPPKIFHELRERFRGLQEDESPEKKLSDCS